MKNKIRGIFCNVTGAVAWGFSGACGQKLMQDFGFQSLQLTFFRMFFSGIILTLIVLLQRKPLDIVTKPKNLLRMVIFAILGFVLSQFTYMKTISLSNAGTATVLQDLGPVFVMIFVCFSAKRLPNKIEILTIFLAFFGVVIIATHMSLNTLVLSPECLFWGILSAVGLLLYTVIPKQLIEKYGALPVSGFGMLIGGITLGIFIKPWNINITFTPEVIFYVLVMIVFGTVIAYTFYLQGVQDIGPVNASMLACIEPISASLFAYLWLGTEFIFIDLIGFAMILSTVFILGCSKDK